VKFRNGEKQLWNEIGSRIKHGWYTEAMTIADCECEKLAHYEPNTYLLACKKLYTFTKHAKLIS